MRSQRSPTDYRHQDNQCHNCGWQDDKDSKSSKSYDKKDDCKCNHFKKKSNKAMHNDSPLCWAQATCPEEGVNLVQDLLCALVLSLGLALTQAAGATTTIMLTMMIASQACSPSVSAHTPLRVMRADVSIALIRGILSLPPSLLQQWREVSAPTNRESCQQQRAYVSHLMSLF